ncbi:MAG: IS110 family transposase [Ardenticatenaceae bacterium]|nr:IS110 family transposase [Ardenticatenaceae bacterium]
MDGMFPHCAGLDVHKRFVVACTLVAVPEGGVKREIKRFGTPPSELRALAAWLAARGITPAAMDSTGIYWKPVYNGLSHSLEVWVVNAAHLAQVPGRKTDIKDAEWIAPLMQPGLVQKSFVPDVLQRDLRDLTRYRTRLTQERTAVVKRLQKLLEDANIKLASVVTDIQGVSARAMLEALIAGEQDETIVAALARGRLRPKFPALVEALAGQVRAHHRFLLHELRAHRDALNERLRAISDQLGQETQAYEGTIERLMQVPGVGRRTAEIILAEIGADVSQFATAGHLASWSCLCPGNRVRGGKRFSGKTRQGQPWLRAALVEAAHAAARTRDTSLASQFHRSAARRGRKRAAVAVAHSIIGIIYPLLADPHATFHDLGADHFIKRDQAHAPRRALKTLEQLGFSVTLSPLAA